MRTSLSQLPSFRGRSASARETALSRIRFPARPSPQVGLRGDGRRVGKRAPASLIRRTQETPTRAPDAGRNNQRPNCQRRSSQFEGSRISGAEFPPCLVGARRGQAMGGWNRTQDRVIVGGIGNPSYGSGSRTAAAIRRRGQSTREYLTKREAPRFQFLCDHPLHRPPFLFGS